MGTKGDRVGIWALAHLPPGKAYIRYLLTIGHPEPAQESWFKSNHPYISALEGYLCGYIRNTVWMS